MGNFSEFGAEENGPRIAIDDQSRWAAQNLKSLATAGEIAQQPADLALKKAHTRLYEAEAGAKETDLEQAKILAKLASGQMPMGAEETDDSPGGSIIQLGNAALRAGAVNKGIELITKGTVVNRNVATTLANQASEAVRQMRARQLQLGTAAQEAMMVTDDASYARYLMQKRAEGEDMSDAPATYAEARPTLNSIIQGGLTAHQKLDLDIKEANQKSLTARRGVANEASQAAAKAATARANLLTLRYNNAVKNGGENSPIALQLKKDRAAALRLQTQLRKNAALAPVDPTDRTVGRTYMAPNGKWGQWTGTGWLAVQAPAADGTLLDEQDDTDDDEGDE